VCVSCRRVSAPTVDTLMMDISPRVNRINLMTGNFLTMFDVPYTIQVFAENDIGESVGSNTITFTRIQSTYTTVCICSTQYRNLCNLRLSCSFFRIWKLCANLNIAWHQCTISRLCNSCKELGSSFKFSSCIKVRSVPKELLQLCHHHQH